MGRGPDPGPALRRGRKRNRGGTSTAAAMFGMTTRSRGREQQQSSHSKSARNKLDGSGERLPSEGCGKRKKAKLDGISRRVSSERSSKKGKSSQDRDILEKRPKKRNRGEDEDDVSCSSAVSSPLREPYMPDGTEISKPIDSAISDKYRDMQEEYYAKIARQMKMPMLCELTPPNCLVNDPTLLHIRESSKKIVLRAAQFIVGLSSSFDGEPLAWCSGFWIDLDSEKRTGTVVTTAHLIRTKRPSPDAWLCKDEYASDVKVTVHLRGGAVAKGRLLYHQKHYNLAFFRVKMHQSIQLPHFIDKVECAQDIFELGRDESVKLVIHHGRVKYSNPDVYERNHHMRIEGPHRDREYDNGGPVIDLDGKVVGMIDSCPEGSFIPSSILLKCFHLWRNFGRIRRPHLGLKFSAISLLNPVQVEDILIEHKINEGLIVHEVSAGSPAERCGIRVGDVIECLDGKCVSTVVELDNMLLSIVVNSGDGLNSDLDVEIQVYFPRRYLRRIKILTVKVSEDGEFVARGNRRNFVTPIKHQEEGGGSSYVAN
ncbi:hypothetical protein QYE76_056227 [Lolium multiflorum]|uniref:PDZ domain-containing protein n=1 Tax=Lolium multiflorum TaxID=4521 RepID=A0AAD8T186_LOLMU|nr:hypothetical protein QYE76_056227 [Lolium multiflorum]